MATSTTEIADTVTSCLSLFKSCGSCLSRGSSDDSLMALEGAQRRFRAWSNSLKVFARSHVSLDAQLHPARNEQIREMTLLLLGVLDENLSLVLNLMSTTKIPNPTADYLKVPFFGIDGSLKRLERLAAAILHATDASLNRRVLVYAEKKQNEAMERSVWQALLTRFPKVVPDTDLKIMLLLSSDDEELSDETQISEQFRALLQSSYFSGIFRALFKTFIFRYYRMVYERERRLKDLNQLQLVIETPRQEESSADPKPHQQYKKSEEPPPVKFKATTIPTSPSKPDDTSSEPTLPNTIDGARFEAKMNTIEESDNETYTVSESGAADYPRPPRLREDATEGICPLCGESCTKDIFEGHKWMSHVSRDIKPYVCISQDCLQNPQFFARSRQWKQHMQKIHTAQWIRSLHNLLNWKCPVCHTTSGTEFASEEMLQQNLIEHMQTSHSDLEEDDLRQLASVSSIPKPRSMDKCPICRDDHRKYSPEPVPLAKGNGLDDQVSTADQAPKASQNHKRARFDIQQSSESENDKDDDENIAHLAEEEQQRDGLFTQISNHGKIEKDVGQHLKALAFYFANKLLPGLDLESNAPLGSDRDLALLDFESLSDQESVDDSPRLPAEIQRSKNDPDTEQVKEQMKCIEFNREQLFNDWGSDRRPPEPSLSPEQLESTFPSVTDWNQDNIWMPLGPEYSITYTTIILVIIELCYSFQWPVLSTLSRNELSLRLEPVKVFSRALCMFQSAKLDNALRINYITEIKKYASKVVSISSDIQKRLDHSMTWSSTLAAKHENDMKELHAIRRSIEFRVTLVHINGYLSIEKFQGLENLPDLEPVHVNLIKEVTGCLSSPSPGFFEWAISAIANEYPFTSTIAPPPHQPSNLWSQAFRKANDTTKKWLEEQGLDLQSSDETQVQAQIKEVISLMKSKQLSEDVSKPQTITITNRKINVGDYLVDAIGFVTMVGDAAIAFAPPQASAPWAVAKAVMKIPVNNIEQKAALVGTIEWFIRITRRGQIYESLYTTETTNEEALPNLHNALVELYTAATELFAKFAAMAKGGAFEKLLTAVLRPKYATDLLANVNKKEEHLDREAQNCEASRFGIFTKDMRTQIRNLKEQLTQLSSPLLRIEDTVSSVFQEVSKRELDELMNFISSETFWKSHDMVTQARVENTGNWLLANQDFRTWQDVASSSAVFLLKGAGGTGKTYLTSRVIDHVKSNLKKSPHDEGFAFFYCNRSGSSMQQPIVVLRSFVRQLSGKAFDASDEIQSSLVQKCAELNNGGRELSYKDCEELILESFNVYSKTTIILDALDESDIETYNLAKALIQIAERSRRPVKVFISSRPDREYLEEIIKDNFLITVDASNQHDDIQKYLEDKLYSTKKFQRRNQEIQDEIKSIFDTKGSGMFRWVYLQVQSLEKCTTDDAVLRRARKLPGDLTGAYKQLWDVIEERDESDVALAERAIQWVLCSIKPLKSEELLEAIRYTIEGSTVVEKGQQSQQEILSLCQDFLTIDEKRGVWMLPHASVAEYFESRGWAGWKCDAFAAKICLNFLNKFRPEEVREGTFASYVEDNWHKHVRRYDEWLGLEKEGEADPSVAADLKRFLGSPNESSDSYRKWAQRDEQHYGMQPSNMALFAMCRFGFYHTLRDWWLEGKITQEMALQKNKWHDNSLTVAAKSGCMPICRHLAGLIDAMHADAGRHAGALISALIYDNRDILKMLVMEAGADVNFADAQEPTAAQYAAGYRPEMLQWMVGQGLVDLEKENESGYWAGNVLIQAASYVKIESVRILLGAGANVNAAVQNGSYGSALVAVAAECRSEDHVETARLLLDSGANPNLPLKGGRYGSALEAVVRVPWDSVTESCGELQHMLLEAGADPTAVSDRGKHGSAMAAAAFNGHKDLLKAMVDRVGADKAIDVLCQSRHPDSRKFVDQAEFERWKDTAAYLANEVGASKDVLHGIGLWDVEPVRTGYGDQMEIRFAEHREERNASMLNF